MNRFLLILVLSFSFAQSGNCQIPSVKDRIGDGYDTLAKFPTAIIAIEKYLSNEGEIAKTMGLPLREVLVKKTKAMTDIDYALYSVLLVARRSMILDESRLGNCQNLANQALFSSMKAGKSKPELIVYKEGHPNDYWFEIYRELLGDFHRLSEGRKFLTTERQSHPSGLEKMSDEDLIEMIIKEPKSFSESERKLLSKREYDPYSILRNDLTPRMLTKIVERYSSLKEYIVDRLCDPAGQSADARSLTMHGGRR